MNNLVEFTAGRMTVEQYEKERAALHTTYGESSAEAAAKRDQFLASLFARSGWTQEELAVKEGKSQRWISYRLVFGRFLNFSTPVLNSDWWPKNITEGKFRTYWEQTSGGNERQRFSEVQKLMANDVIVRQKIRPSILNDIIDRFADGKWHAVETIANALNTTVEHIADTLANTRQSSRIRAIEGPVVIEICWDTQTLGDIDNRIKHLLDYLQRLQIVSNDSHCRSLRVGFGTAPDGCRVRVRSWCGQ